VNLKFYLYYLSKDMPLPAFLSYFTTYTIGLVIILAITIAYSFILGLVALLVWEILGNLTLLCYFHYSKDYPR